MAVSDYDNRAEGDGLLRRLGLLIVGLRPSVAHDLGIELVETSVDDLGADGMTGWRFGIRSVGRRASEASHSAGLARYCTDETAADLERWQFVRPWLRAFDLTLSSIGAGQMSPLQQQGWAVNLAALGSRPTVVATPDDVASARGLSRRAAGAGSKELADRLGRLADRWPTVEHQHLCPPAGLIDRRYAGLVVEAVGAVRGVPLAS